MIKTHSDRLDPRLKAIVDQYSWVFKGEGKADRNYYDRYDHAFGKCDKKKCHHCKMERKAKRRLAANANSVYDKQS